MELHPIRLSANRPRQFYRGGEAIAALRGESGSAGEFGPEDWVASTTTRFGRYTEGLTTLPDGRLLRDAVRADPHGWLGRQHLSTFGDSTALLVKLLDAGQRLPVHFHPDDAFALRHLGSHYGKTEAWIVVGTRGADPRVYAGFRETMPERTIAEWVREQDTDAMLGALNEITVAEGDTVFIPAGLPHAIGAGVFVVELQQPTDFSLTLEWQGFLDSPEQGHLGVGFDTAFRALDHSGWDDARLRELVRHTAGERAPAVDVLAPGARPFFRAEALAPSPAVTLDPSFAVLVVLDGSGVLRGESGKYPLSRGDTLVLPHGAGEHELTGALTALRCRPPSP